VSAFNGISGDWLDGVKEEESAPKDPNADHPINHARSVKAKFHVVRPVYFNQATIDLKRVINVSDLKVVGNHPPQHFFAHGEFQSIIDTACGVAPQGLSGRALWLKPEFDWMFLRDEHNNTLLLVPLRKQPKP
jgi:hypothetical protein